MSDTLDDFRKFVDLIEGRAMACDGPVTPFLEQLHVASDAEKERFTAILAKIYQSRRANENQVKHMVNSFLSWRLPEDFSPDAGITFKREFNENTPFPMKHEPSGTNLFNANQAEAMIRHLLHDIPSSQPMGTASVEAAEARITALEALLVEAERALEPFAEQLEAEIHPSWDDTMSLDVMNQSRMHLTVGNLRATRTALTKIKETRNAD